MATKLKLGSKMLEIPFRQETPAYAVANTPQPKRANGRVVNGRVLKHEPYRKRALTAKPLKGYILPIGGYR